MKFQEQQQTPSPSYDARAATKLAIGAGIVAGFVVYLLNGQDPARAAIAALLWVAIGWYGGKALFWRGAASQPAQECD